MKKFTRIIIVFLFGASMFTSCKKEYNFDPLPSEQINDNDNLLMGNPSNATASESNKDNYLMKKTWYALSYNEERGTPNWVSWHLYSNDLGSVPRYDIFMVDTSLPAAWYHVADASYTGSGFDRGHNCPSADRDVSLDANRSTFFMTNIFPQAPDLNQQTWSNMESYVRSRIFDGNEAYIVMGTYGIGGVGDFGLKNTIDGGNVTVPSNVYKIVLLITNGNNDTSRVTSTSRVIAVDIPNSNTIVATQPDWKQYRTTVDAIESATGYNFLSRLPVTLQDELEGVVDNQ